MRGSKECSIFSKPCRSRLSSLPTMVPSCAGMVMQRLFSGRGLKVVNGRLSAELDEGRRAIEDLDHQLRGRAFSTSLAARPVFVVRPIGRPLILSILSDGPVVADLFASGGAIVVACDPDLRPRGGEEILAAAFHLTRAEASLAAGVATGLSLVDYAEQAGLAEATVRTLMKRVLANQTLRAKESSSP